MEPAVPPGVAAAAGVRIERTGCCGVSSGEVLVVLGCVFCVVIEIECTPACELLIEILRCCCEVSMVILPSVMLMLGAPLGSRTVTEVTVVLPSEVCSILAAGCCCCGP